MCSESQITKRCTQQSVSITRDLERCLPETLIIYFLNGARGGAAVNQCATGPMFTGSIPDGVIGNFHWLGRNMTWGRISL